MYLDWSVQVHPHVPDWFVIVAHVSTTTVKIFGIVGQSVFPFVCLLKVQKASNTISPTSTLFISSYSHQSAIYTLHSFGKKSTVPHTTIAQNLLDAQIFGTVPNYHWRTQGYHTSGSTIHSWQRGVCNRHSYVTSCHVPLIVRICLCPLLASKTSYLVTHVLLLCTCYIHMYTHMYVYM